MGGWRRSAALLLGRERLEGGVGDATLDPELDAAEMGNDVASAGRAGCGFDSSFGAGNGDAATSSVPPINRRQSTAMARHASLFQAEPLHGRVAQVGLPSRGLSAKHAQAKSSKEEKERFI